MRIRAARAAALAAHPAQPPAASSERLREAEARSPAAATARRRPSSGGPWAIPWPIVQCESGGQNLPPNSAGASGYYQFIPSTWKGLGGIGPHAYLRPKAEQDALAAKLWAGGSGAPQLGLRRPRRLTGRRQFSAAARVGVLDAPDDPRPPRRRRSSPSATPASAQRLR